MKKHESITKRTEQKMVKIVFVPVNRGFWFKALDLAKRKYKLGVNRFYVD